MGPSHSKSLCQARFPPPLYSIAHRLPPFTEHACHLPIHRGLFVGSKSNKDREGAPQSFDSSQMNQKSFFFSLQRLPHTSYPQLQLLAMPTQVPHVEIPGLLCLPQMLTGHEKWEWPKIRSVVTGHSQARQPCRSGLSYLSIKPFPFLIPPGHFRWQLRGSQLRWAQLLTPWSL